MRNMPADAVCESPGRYKIYLSVLSLAWSLDQTSWLYTV